MKFGTLQVFPRQGVLQEHGLELPTAVIGRGEGAGILVDDFSVSRRHARLTVESSKLLVEDLGSVGGTFVNGERLEPGIRHLVEAGAVLRFGEIEARFVPPGAAEPVAAGGIAEPLEDATFGVSGLSVALAAPAQAIEPGRGADATVVVVNRGRIVDNVRIEILDLPGDWYTIDTPAFAILPGGRTDVKVTLHPPRRHDATAGIYEFTVRVRTQEYEEHAEVPGSLEVLPFESATIEFEAVRSKKRFRLVAENNGNQRARYELSGRDEEQAFKYDFETPAVELEPGEKRIVDLSVRRKRQLFGFPTQPPFEVVGRNETGAEITARGQLSINPPLQRFKMPVAMALVLALLVATALAVFIIADDDGTQTASAEDPYAGVHLCEDEDAKAEQAKRNADAADDKPLAGATVVGPYDGGRPIFGQVDGTGAPFFAQSDARWGGDEYARSTELPNGKDWCGTTIEQCGCAMTSVSVMLALYDLVQMPGGEALSPQSLNNWFNGAARQTDRGWVSRGYIYGDVIWSAANELSGEIAKVNPSARTVRFVRTGSGSVEEIRADLEAGRPVVVEVPGHWIAAVGLDGDEILINDPFYRDRKTLSAYAGKVRSSVHYEPSSDLSSVVITAPADVKFKITDKQGRVVNTGQGTLDQPTDQLNQIPGASLSQKHAWRDPTCIESAPPPDAGTNQVVLPGSRDDYTIEIIGTGGQAASVAIHTYGKDGTSSIATIEGVEGTKADLQFDPNAEKPVITIQNNGGGTTAASTPTPNTGGAGGGEDETPTSSPSPLPPPTATQTPFIEQRTAMTLPAEAGQTRVEVATNSGFELGDPIRFAPGLPNQEDNLIVGFGSFVLATPLQFSHGPGEPILRLQRPPGQGPGLPPGVTPPPSTGPLLPPEQVVMACTTIYQASPKLATFICDVQVVGDFTTTRWTINGQVVTEFSGSTSFVMTFPGDTPANISATVCNITLCRSTSKNEAVEFPPGLSGTTAGGGTGGTSGGSGAAPTPPPAGAVAVTCGTQFDQNQVPAVANVTCQANFSGDFTSVSWSAPGGAPASASGQKKEFQTKLVNDLGAPTTLKITATVCNFGTCRTSNPVTVGIGQTRTIIDSEPKDPVTEEREVHQRHSVTLFAAVVGLNGIVPQGGNVQFYADNNAISPSAALFTVGSTSVAQIVVETGSRAGLTTIGTHTIYAVYSGGINAFGSVSQEMDLEVLPPLPDECDSVDEDDNDVIDDFTSGTGDTSCDISVPKNLGGGTVLNSLTISTGNPAHQDGAPNAVVVPPGQPLDINGSVGRTDYCPGCIRQVYIGIGGYDTQPSPTKIGPQCVYSGGTPLVPSAFPFFGFAEFNAPTTPGVYYVRATTTLDYFCVGPGVGPPDRSVGRIVVKGPVVTQLELHAASSATDNNPWDDGLSTPATSVEAGKKLIVLAKVPPGATGRVDIEGVGGAALSAPVCPSSGQLVIPSIQPTPIGCTPGEARAMTPVITDEAASLLVRARFEDGFPPQLTAPQTGDPADYPFFESPVQTNPGPYPAGPADPNGWAGSNVVSVKVLVTANVVIEAAPSPVEMGQQFTLTATVTSANTALALFGTGGVVKFMAGSEQIGSDKPISNANGTVSILWTPRNCNGAPPVGMCPAANEGSPFNAQDETGTDFYTDVHAVFASGTSDLKGGTSGNINVDVHKASSSTSMTVTPASVGVGGTISLEATVTPAWSGFNLGSGQVQFKARKSSQSIAQATDLGSPATLVETPAGSGIWKASLNNVSTGGDTDVIDVAGDWLLTAHFAGTSEVGTSVSTDTSLTVTKAAPTLTVTLPNSGTITVGDTDPPGDPNDVRAVVTGNPSNRLDDPTAQLIYRNGTTVLDTDSITNLGASVLGSEMEVSGLSAGTYSITVEYTGNDYFSGKTEGPFTLIVNQFTPTVTMNDPTNVAIGNNLSLSAGVNGSGAASPNGGTVSFYLNSVADANLIGTASVTSGTASLTGATAVVTGDNGSCGVSPSPTGCLLTAGDYTILARYNGSTNVQAATSGTQSVTLNKRNSNVNVSNASTVLGTDVTLTATLTPASTPDSAVSLACTACAQFQVSVGGVWTDIGTDGDVVSSGGASPVFTATLAQTTASGPLGANGAHSVRAVFADPGAGVGQTTNGHVNYNTSTSGNATVTVGPPPPTVTLANASMPLNGSTTLTAVVVPPSGRVPTCSNCLQFREGSTTFATVSVVSDGSGGYQATTTINGGSTAFPTIAGSPYTVTAVYAPSGNTGAAGAADDVGGPATSNQASVSVTARTTSVSVTGNTTGTVLSSHNFVVSVSPSGGAGTVKLYADGVEVDSDAADTDGTTTLQYTPSSTGNKVMTAEYISTDTTNYASDATSNNHTIAINPLTVSITVQANGQDESNGDNDVDVTVGATVTLTATLNFTTTITGNVQFKKDTANFGSPVAIVAGVATISWTAEANGNYNFTATFTSTHSNYADQSSSNSLTVDTSP